MDRGAGLACSPSQRMSLGRIICNDGLGNRVGFVIRRLTFVAFLLCALGGRVGADTTVQAIVDQLRAQGFETITVSRTMLGRTRVTATSPRYSREVVINPGSGEILRDYWEAREHSGSKGPSLVDPNTREDRKGRGRGRGRGGNDDDDDDDDRDDDGDDDRDDNSGRGKGDDDGDDSSGRGSDGDDGDDD